MTKMSNGRPVSAQTTRNIVTPEFEARQKWLKTGQEAAARQSVSGLVAEDDVEAAEGVEAVDAMDHARAADAVDEVEAADANDAMAATAAEDAEDETDEKNEDEPDEDQDEEEDEEDQDQDEEDEDEPDEEETDEEDGDGTDRAEPDATGRMEDACMSFLESTEGRLTYHQAQLVRLACEGFDSDETLDRAFYILNRAKMVSDGRPAAIPIDDPLNDEVMDFLESHGWSLEYHEWEVVRRICRGCDAETLAETAFVLERARYRHEND